MRFNRLNALGSQVITLASTKSQACSPSTYTSLPYALTSCRACLDTYVSSTIIAHGALFRVNRQAYNFKSPSTINTFQCRSRVPRSHLDVSHHQLSSTVVAKAAVMYSIVELTIATGIIAAECRSTKNDTLFACAVTIPGVSCLPAF